MVVLTDIYRGLLYGDLHETNNTGDQPRLLYFTGMFKSAVNESDCRSEPEEEQFRKRANLSGPL